jgi:hypothetical protein
MRVLFFVIAVVGVAFAPAAKPKPAGAGLSVRANDLARR